MGGGSLATVQAFVAAGGCLSREEACAAFGIILDGGATTAEVAALLGALHARGETAEELTGAVQALRARMIPVRLEIPAGRGELVDVCGTGGDQQGTLNISTAVAFVLAGAGVLVAKHGNRAASSRAGGADVLAALGVRLDPPAHRLSAILAAAGCVFLFAPNHHPGLRHAAAARAGLGTRSLFNLMGPLANPAGVRRQLTGTYDPAWVGPMAQTLAELGHQTSWVVHGQGLDELTLAGANRIVMQHGSRLTTATLDGTSLGLAAAPVAALAGGDAAHNAAVLAGLLEDVGLRETGQLGAYRDTVLLNTAAALVVAGRTDDMRAALALARASLGSGAARASLEQLRTASESD